MIYKNENGHKYEYPFSKSKFRKTLIENICFQNINDHEILKNFLCDLEKIGYSTIRKNRFFSWL